jgi:hypothetical protein
MQATRYLDSTGRNVELIQVTPDRYLLCTDSPCYISADQVDSLYEPAEERRDKTARRQGRKGGRRRRDRMSLAEDLFRARTNEMLQSVELNLSLLRSQIGDDWGFSIG